MPRTTSQTKTTRQDGGAAGAPKGRGQSRTLAWTGTENVPRWPWWRWAIFGYVALLLIVGFSYQGEWILALLVAAIFATYIVIFRRPTSRRYRLTGTTLTIAPKNRDSNARDAIDLQRFRAAYLDDPWIERQDVIQQPTLVLLPQKRLGIAITVFLPAASEKQEKIMTAITSHVPLEDRTAYRNRLLDHLSRWLRLQ